jgi:hypothetical protein
MDRFSYRKKLVESAQVRTRDLNLPNHVIEGRIGGWFLPQGQMIGMAAYQFGIQQVLGAARFDGLLHAGLGMLCQQLQHADVLPGAEV